MPRAIVISALLLFASACAAANPEKVPADLQAAVSRANEAFAAATRDLNVEPLRNHFEGDILKSLSGSVARAQQEQRYAISKLNRMEWIDVEISGDSADVITIENWSHRHLRLGTSECLFEISGRDVKQTYHLRRSGDEWRIVGITDDPGNQPARRIACAGAAS